MMREQTFTITVETQRKDGCGNAVAGYNAGDIRAALLKALPHYESISVSEDTVSGETEGGR